MLQLTKKTEYGLIALTHLARRAGAVVSVREICEHYPVPRRLVAEVLKDLCHASLVESHRGSSGGYTLARQADAIHMGDVVEALEGQPALTSCSSLDGTVTHACSVESVCPIKNPIDALRLEFWNLLARTSLRDLLERSSMRHPAIATVRQ